MPWPGSPTLWVPLGLDADEDGSPDLAVTGWSAGGLLHYGPFAGELSAPESSFYTPSVTLGLLPDHGGPGHHALFAGFGDYDYEQIFLYDLTIPRTATGTRCSASRAARWRWVRSRARSLGTTCA
jgi:hypothetical protein